MNSKIISAIIVLLAIGAGIYFYMHPNGLDMQPSQSNGSTMQNGPTAEVPIQAPGGAPDEMKARLCTNCGQLSGDAKDRCLVQYQCK